MWNEARRRRLFGGSACVRFEARCRSSVLACNPVLRVWTCVLFLCAQVCQHALSAVVPDFRNRVWWWPPLRLGLLYACRNGAVMMDNPTGEKQHSCDDWMMIVMLM
jgi:hypothetical protein